MQDASAVTFLFTDIEGSTRLWEQEPDRMRPALARHDAIARAAVERHRGTVVKMTGDGMHAAFEDPADAVRATLDLQCALADAEGAGGLALRVRCGLHAGAFERRDNDFFGAVVNRAARIMSAAHGGQMLLSRAVAERLAGRLPDGAALRDLGVVRLRDLAQPERLFQLVHPQLRGEFPALRSLEETPNNLPHALTSFVGRERELADLARMLGENRLVTVLGIGGIGKSRLAMHAAAEGLERWPDGVWVAELGPLSDERRVAQSIASVLSVVPEGGRPVEDALARHLKGRETLLVLDNCEHLAGACAQLAKQLLVAAPGLKILATSREPLRVGGEAVYLLPPLAVPDVRVALDAQAAASFPAVRLFVERAIAAQPAFEVDAANAPTIAAICHRLDGIPLAIELAAARVRAMSPQQIALRLDDRFRLLTAGDPTVSPRQRTLRALIDWSYELLSGRERALLRELSVFAGGWTLEAAETVCAPASNADESVLDLLTNLIDKSLVAMDVATQRYRLLETVRGFAAQHLADSGGGAAVHRRHFEYYAALAAAAKPELVRANQAEWLARLDAERENILSAHAWALQGGVDPLAVLDLQLCVKLYWINRGLLDVGHRATAEALARLPADERGMARCRGLFALGQYSSFMGRYADALKPLEEALAIARAHGEVQVVAAVLRMLGMAAHGNGEPARARAFLEEGYAHARRGGESRTIASAANELAQLHRVLGELQVARPLYEEMLGIARGMQDMETIAIGLLNLAMLEATDANTAAAAAHLREAIGITAALRSPRMAQSVLEVCAGLAAASRDWRCAAWFFGAAEAQARTTGLRREPADEAFLAPLVEIARHALGAESFASAAAEGAAADAAPALQRAQAWLDAA